MPGRRPRRLVPGWGGTGGNGFGTKGVMSTKKGGIGPSEGSVSEGGSLGSLLGLVAGFC